MGGDLLSKLPWLKPLLRTKFYSSCECNSAKPCSFFCRDCMGSAFCEDCLYHPHKHVGHQSLRVYKSSSRVGLRVKSIRKLMDVSDIQPYTCNSSKLVYINRKGRNDHVNRINGRKVDKCDVCGHELQCYSSKFCSIECKVQSEIEVEETEEEEVGISISTTRLLQVDPKSFRKRMRKGTPLRSPFF
ncbi:hypothetical protein ERO13_A09G122900v2 [Gossypium hirsutum]|uniref:B box-type domain-containing protein n=3 Tax=Gossypium TaxID=3633 RepID=A0A5J5UEX8_GOSBA|nr:hypothetical protein ES319_A09G130900v1 [Gossypium barbadense]KAG4183651.1 hypothetical protein ERO13_A09G122900v2 [Gossypium hirsutum]TYH02579.1 hypothetical protein ES288_A09G152100v1 [Gossypium darwinii]